MNLPVFIRERLYSLQDTRFQPYFMRANPELLFKTLTTGDFGIEVWVRGLDHPVFLVRASASRRTANFVRNEYRSLASLANVPEVRGSVPEVIDYVESDGHNVLVETWMDGYSLNNEALHLLNHESPLFNQSIEWVTNLGVQTRHERVFSEDDYSTLVLKPAQAISQFGELDKDLRRFVADVTEKWRAWVGQPFPFVTMHGDFHPGNVLVSKDGNGIFVADWDLAEVSGLPLYDLLYYLAWFWSITRRLNTADSMRCSFLDNTFFADVAARSIGDYCLKLRLDHVISYLIQVSALHFFAYRVERHPSVLVSDWWSEAMHLWQEVLEKYTHLSK